MTTKLFKNISRIITEKQLSSTVYLEDHQILQEYQQNSNRKTADFQGFVKYTILNVPQSLFMHFQRWQNSQHFIMPTWDQKRFLAKQDGLFAYSYAKKKSALQSKVSIINCAVRFDLYHYLDIEKKCTNRYPTSFLYSSHYKLGQ